MANVELKTTGQLLDELCIANLKIWHLIDKVESGEATVAEPQAVQKWNARRNDLIRALDKRFDQADIGEKVYK